MFGKVNSQFHIRHIVCLSKLVKNILYKDIDSLIDWCLTPTLAIFQLFRGVTKFIINLDTYKTIRNKT